MWISVFGASQGVQPGFEQLLVTAVTPLSFETVVSFLINTV